MKKIEWSEIEKAFIEMQQIGYQAIITLPEIIEDNTIYCDGGEYFVYGISVDEKEIALLNLKEQMFGDFKDEIIYDERADVVVISEKELSSYFDQVVATILDKEHWVPCHYVEIEFKDGRDIDRIYLVKVGEKTPLDDNEKETGRYLQFNVNTHEFEYAE